MTNRARRFCLGDEAIDRFLIFRQIRTQDFYRDGFFEYAATALVHDAHVAFADYRLHDVTPVDRAADVLIGVSTGWWNRRERDDLAVRLDIVGTLDAFVRRGGAAARIEHGLLLVRDRSGLCGALRSVDV